MQALDLNLASRPFRNNTPLWLGYGLGVVALIWFTTWNIRTYIDYDERLTGLQDEVSSYDRRMTQLRLRDERATAGINKVKLRALNAQVDKANDIIEWKAFSWTRLFNLLEQLQPYDVKMTGVRPVFYASERRSGREKVPEGAVPVRVQGVAKNLRAFLAFQRELLLDYQVGLVEPLRNVKLENNEMSFEMKFLYYPEPGDHVEDPEYIEPVEGQPRASPADIAREEARARAAESGDGATGDAGGNPGAQQAPEDQQGLEKDQGRSSGDRAGVDGARGQGQPSFASGGA